MNPLAPACLVTSLCSAIAAGLTFSKRRPGEPLPSKAVFSSRVPLATLLLLACVAVPTTLQFRFPAILSTLQRDYARFASGEWWRVITPLFVQDGGVAGSVFNLVSLLLIGAVTERLRGSRQTIAIFLIGGVLSEIVAFGWQPVGAGNSVGNFSLAASISVACLVPQASKVSRAFALLSLVSAAVLVAVKDIHGAAAVAGAILALVLNHLTQDKQRIKELRHTN
jgi:rhomboid protease GluP